MLMGSQTLCKKSGKFRPQKRAILYLISDQPTSLSNFLLSPDKKICSMMPTRHQLEYLRGATNKLTGIAKKT